MSSTIARAVGEAAAWRVMPQSYALPSQAAQFAAWAEAHPEAADETWVLKQDDHEGRGIRLLPLAEAARLASAPVPRGQKPFVTAQRYVHNPSLIDGRKYGLRLWVVVPGFEPLRAYMYSLGLVSFANERHDGADEDETEAGVGGRGRNSTAGCLTNIAQNDAGIVWTLQQLEEHLGREQYGRLFDTIHRHTALALSAALKSIRDQHKSRGLRSGMTALLMGFDYIVDADLHPWLIEINRTPSMRSGHADPQYVRLQWDHKQAAIKDFVRLLGVHERVAAREALPPDQRTWDKLLPNSTAAVRAAVVAELGRRGGFVPLMRHFPVGEAGVSVPWSDDDRWLRSLLLARDDTDALQTL